MTFDYSVQLDLTCDVCMWNSVVSTGGYDARPSSKGARDNAKRCGWRLYPQEMCVCQTCHEDRWRYRDGEIVQIKKIGGPQ